MLLRIEDIKQPEPVMDPESDLFAPMRVKGKSRMAMGGLQPVGELIGTLERDEHIHIPVDGNWSTPHMMEHVLKQIGPAECWVTSWSVKEQAIRILMHLVDTGQLTGLHCLFDERIRVQCPQAFQLAAANIADIWLSKIHAKLVVLMNESWNIAIESSANLTRNPRIETYTICTHASIAQGHQRWIAAKIAKANPFRP